MVRESMMVRQQLVTDVGRRAVGFVTSVLFLRVVDFLWFGPLVDSLVVAAVAVAAAAVAAAARPSDRSLSWIGDRQTCSLSLVESSCARHQSLRSST